jgi:hypothetical protein
MKHLLTVLLALLLLAACDKYNWSLGDYWEGFQENGAATAERNGDDWEASSFGNISISGFFNLGFVTYERTDSLPTEALSFSNIPMETGEFLVHIIDTTNYANLYSIYIQGYDDYSNGSFRPDESKSNWIKVESVDTAQRIVRGSFDVHYRIDPRSKDTGFPRTVHFKNGRFEVRLK